MFGLTEPVEARSSYADLAEASARADSLGNRKFNVHGNEVSTPDQPV
jgi:hypothetical protein